MGFSLILLLGQKVSRLGFSTHCEKVEAVVAMQRPTNVKELQRILGMLVYFSLYIPFYSFIAKPLFELLQKGTKWNWEAHHEVAFQQAKEALTVAPVLAHLEAGKPYCLYTDASDYALGAALQQVQQIRVKDLQHTEVYEKLKKAHANGLPVPSLVTKLVKEIDERPLPPQWGDSFKETEVYVERVIAYWSRTL